MPPKKEERSTRSLSRNRGTKRGSAPADPNSTHARTIESTTPSRNRDGDFPDTDDAEDVGSSKSIMNTNQAHQIVDDGSKDAPGSPLNHDIENKEQPSNTAHPSGSIPLEGDNGGLPKSSGTTHNLEPGDPLNVIFQELRAMRTDMGRLDKLDKIEKTTSSLDNQISKLVNRTTKIETKVDANSSQVRNLKEEITALKEIVITQGRTIEEQGEAIASFNHLKENLTKNSQETIDEMNNLLQQQKEQVESFHQDRKRLKLDIGQEVEAKIDSKIDSLSQDLDHKDLKKQAYYNRQNLLVIGMAEDQTKDTQSQITEYFKDTLKISNPGIKVAYRIGPEPKGNNNYHRPIFIKFQKISFRNAAWKKRMDISAEDGQTKVRIQADLPKKLREDVRVLYRVSKAAASIQEFQSVAIRNYAILFNGKEYKPRELELLPHPLRPSTLASRKSDEALAFFSHHTPFSNHHHSEFVLGGLKFQNVEHYLAYKRAHLSGQANIIQKATHATHPPEAKSILNSLKEDHVTEWNDNLEDWALQGIRAKFQQNPKLAKELRDTGNLRLGEASRSERWGIGMDLNNPDILDTSKWSTTGDLLGQTLMKVRQELNAGT